MLFQLTSYDIVCYIIAITDLCLFIISSIQLFRITKNEIEQQQYHEVLNGDSKEKRNSLTKYFQWSGKKFFHAIICACMLVRSSFFFFQPTFVNNDKIGIQSSYIDIWNQTGSVLFFLAYFMLLLFWGQFYYQLNGNNQQIMKKIQIPLYILFLLLMIAFSVFCTLAIVWADNEKNSDILDEWGSIFVSILALFVAFGFLYFGIKLWLLLRKHPSISPRKQVQIIKVVGVAVGCTICFIARATIAFYSVYNEINHSSKSFNVPLYLLILYFFVFEVAPISLMLFLLRKLPRWKIDTESKKLINS